MPRRLTLALGLALAALLVLTAGRADAGPAFAPDPCTSVLADLCASDTVPASEAGTATISSDAAVSLGVEGAGSGAVAAGAVAVAAPVLVAGAIAFGLDQEWEYYHPTVAPSGDPEPGDGTSYGGGEWADGGCQEDGGSGSYNGDSCDTDSNGIHVVDTIETSPGNGATSGEFKVVEYWVASRGDYSYTPQLVCHDDTHIPATSGSVDTTPGPTFNILFDAAGCASHGGAYDLALNQSYVSVDYLLTGPSDYPTSQPTSGTATPKVDCADGTTVVGQPVVYTSSSPAAVPMVLPHCKSGVLPIGAEVDDTGAADPTTPTVSWTAPADYSDPTSQYARCLPGGDAAPCSFRLGQLTSTGFQTCGDQVDCTMYQAQAAGSTNTSADYDSDTYQCRWGPYDMPLVDCDAQGAQAEGITAAPDADTDPAGLPVGTDDSCFPHGWGVFNPASWIVTPLKCLFIPSPKVWAQQMTSAKTAADGTAPVQLVDAVSNVGEAVVSAVPAGGSVGCDGPAFPPVPTIGIQSTWYPLNDCSSPQSVWAGVVRPIFEVILYVGALLAAARLVGSAFGVNISIRNRGAVDG